MNRSQFEKLTSEAAALSDDLEEFLWFGKTLHALALSKLPPDEREATLTAIESLGTLRQAVEKFPGARSSPYPRVGNGHAA